jgi:hypothetical protein
VDHRMGGLQARASRPRSSVAITGALVSDTDLRAALQEIPAEDHLPFRAVQRPP